MSSHNPHVDAALATEFEEDRKAYEALSPRAKKLAEDRAKRLYWYTSGINNAGYHVLRKGDDALKYSGETVVYYATNAAVYTAEALKWAFYGPYIAIAYTAKGAGWLIKEGAKGIASAAITAAGATMQGLGAAFGFGAKRAEKSKIVPNRWRQSIVNTFSGISDRFYRSRRILKVARWRTRKAIEQGWKNTKDFFADGLNSIAYGARWFSRNIMYKPLVWAFNPRKRDGSPLFGSESANRKWAFAAAGLIGVASGLGLLGLKTFLFGLHAYAGTSVVMHAGISLIAKASTFVVLPIIAASKRGLKNVPEIRAMAYRYRLMQDRDNKAHEEIEQKNGVGKLTFVTRKIRAFFQHIKDESVPAFYEHGHKTGPIETPPASTDKGEGGSAVTVKPAEYRPQNVAVRTPLADVRSSFGTASSATQKMLKSLPHRLRKVAALNRPVRAR